MKRSARRLRGSLLPESILKRLNAYTLAANADNLGLCVDFQNLLVGLAGIGGLALALPAHAEVIYNPTQVSIHFQSSYLLNPAGAQVAPFQISAGFTSPGAYWDLVSFTPRTAGAGVVVHNTSWSVMQLPPGAEIGASRQFGSVRGLVATFGPYGGGTFRNHDGFRFDQAGYVGFKFAINGQEHYGWARMAVIFNPDAPKHRLSAKLDGFAYESIPNKPIRAGQTKEDAAAGGIPQAALPAQPDLVPARSDDPASRAVLGLLALGHNGIPMWRRNASQVP